MGENINILYECIPNKREEGLDSPSSLLSSNIYYCQRANAHPPPVPAGVLYTGTYSINSKLRLVSCIAPPTAIQFWVSEAAEYKRFLGIVFNVSASFFANASSTVVSSHSSTTKWLSPPEAIIATVFSLSHARIASATAFPNSYDRLGVG